MSITVNSEKVVKQVGSTVTYPTQGAIVSWQIEAIVVIPLGEVELKEFRNILLNFMDGQHTAGNKALLNHCFRVTRPY